MKNQLRAFFLNRLLKKQHAKRTYVGWKNAQHFTLLFDDSETTQNKNAEVLKSLLQEEGKTTCELHFVPGKKPKENARKNAFYGSEIGFFGQPKKSVFNHLTNPTDVLIYWSGMVKSPNDFLALQTDAELKIGVNKQLPFFDVLVSEIESKPRETALEIIKYLKLINK